MNLLQLLLPKESGKVLTFCDFFVFTFILFQFNNNSVNCNRSLDLNLTNDDYNISGIVRRSKRQNGIVTAWGLKNTDILVLDKQLTTYFNGNELCKMSTAQSAGFKLDLVIFQLQFLIICNFDSKCEIPNYGPHVRYTILGEIPKTYQPGEFSQQYYTLEVSCERGYNLKPFSDKRAVCINGQWNPTLTINCLQTCPSLKSSISTRVKCKYHDLPLENCNNPIEGTTAILSCNPLYEQDYLQTNSIRLCKFGRWNPSISECYPICGTKRPKGRGNIVNGQNAVIGDYPWQIGIYNTKKEFLCGGSIIDRHIILTAAHCLTDFNGNVKPTEDYLIAAGKYYRNYDDIRDEYVQYSNVQRIYVPERYTGLINNMALDIAIIILTDPFTITVGVQPVCIERNGESPYLHLSFNTNGTVTGWGFTKEGRELSEVLKELIIPIIPFRQCLEEVPRRFRKFFTNDKICGGYLNNETSICGGDSGGALVFQNSFSERYYVKGIVSTSPATEELVCDSNQYSLFTSIEDHIEFIVNISTYNQIQQSIELTNEDIDNCSREYFISEMLHQTSSGPPQIIPKVTEFLINASSTFEFRCLSKNPVTWTSPDFFNLFLREMNKSSTITTKSSQCGTVYESILTISNVSYLDVGFYYCHENTSSDFTDITKSSSIYIYVYDDQKLFLMPENKYKWVNENQKYTIPCRPTAPDVQVKLIYKNSGVEVPLNSADGNYVTYDSKMGFNTIANDEPNDYYYICKFSRGSYTESSSIKVIYNRPF